MTINCNKWRELASEYSEGTLPPEMQNAVRSHLSQCTACQQDELLLRAIHRELNVLPEVEPPLFFRDNVIAKIERQEARSGPRWLRWLPQNGRLMVGGLLTTGTVAATILLLSQPVKPPVAPDSVPVKGGPVVPLLPGGGVMAPVSAQPQFRIARMTTVLPDSVAYDFTFWLENAKQGEVRFQMADDTRKYRFALSGKTPQTLRVPVSVVGEKPVVELTARWSADGKQQTRHLFVPVPNAPPVDVRQSFGLPEGSLIQMARELAARYNQPVTLDNVPATQLPGIAARNETAEEVLRRALTTLPANESAYLVSAVSGGLLVEAGASKADPTMPLNAAPSMTPAR